MPGDLSWWANWSQIIGAFFGVVSVLLTFFSWIWPSPNRRLLQRIALVASFLFVAFICFWLGNLVSGKESSTTIEVSVSASAFPFGNTGVALMEGDDVQIIVMGEDSYWDCGTGLTTAEGETNYKYNLFTLPDANLCELVGSTQPGSFFRVGSYKHFTVRSPGYLFLGANDEAKTDKYIDNKGTLTVQIIVK